MSRGRNFPCTRTRGALFVVMCRSLPPISIIFFNNSLSVIPAIAHFSLENRFAQYFFHRRLAQRRLNQPAAPQRYHPLLHGLFLQLQR